MIKIIPSILTNSPKELATLLGLCEGVTDRVSIDIVDGKFADNKTIYPEIAGGIETGLSIEYQLMVEEPINWVEQCIRGQASTIIGHIEKMSNQAAFVGKVQSVGAKVGLAIDVPTPISRLDPAILNNLDTVLVMSVPAGFTGQKFDPVVLEKLAELDDIRSRDDTPFVIQDDGGITLDNIYNVHKAGADEVSIGKRIFEKDLRTEIENYQRAAHLASPKQ